ncbi:gliding motility lipoprotein GldH [Antarcticibacterium arcticum]|uniref:Gliding motility lipoprotein GldH n=1 Tax=Antarcticibacterium arcticum TaxID=2585771 RepID=A0A5B8YQ79_9FLAO|nr:gliding motility lipoprotein GldH [Antarcticibacterium arcticum]QED38516.1 gliding motility lipoprotein GldH [Antarcticibacterium arcticum]
MHKSFLPVFIIIIGGLFSCDSNRVYDEYESIPNTWNKDSIVTFNLPVMDSVPAYNLFINVRNTNDFAYSNLFLIAQIHFPQGKVITDTLEYRMAEPSGQWLGTGFGDVKENKLWYKEQVRFNEPGRYKVSLQQAMRKSGSEQGIENLEGLTQVGLRIENTQN